MIRILTAIVLAAFLSAGIAQKAFRDVVFSDSCETGEAKMLAFDDATPVYTCEETAGR